MSLDDAVDNEEFPHGRHSAVASTPGTDAPETEAPDGDARDTVLPQTAVLNTIPGGSGGAADGSDDAAAPADATSTVIAAAKAWLAQDPDPETRAQLRALVSQAGDGDDAAIADLHSRFDERLAFGTAGLRGEISAGSNRMNRVLVSQAAAGLAAYLLQTAAPGTTPTVVVGYDGRKNSSVFASDTAELMAGAGVRAILLPRLLPTPVLAFAVRHLGASAGVMVTASHNPPNDNGYKVYLGGANGGSQIVSPDDAAIAAEILRVAAERLVPELPRGRYETAPESVVEAYVAATARVAHPPRAQVNAVYTALHGVGWHTTHRVLDAAGFDLPTLVDAQIAPDAAFPTVAFPNPEEPGAMDLAYETAREVGAELIIANDPDADRLAVAIPDAGSPDGYRRLSGNETGAILGWRAATSMHTQLVLDALEQAVWVRRREGSATLPGLVHHTDAGSQYTSIAFTERLAEVGVTPSIGTVGDAYDNALAETVIGLFKTELINPNRPWKTVDQVEIATLRYVHWFNNQRLYEENGDIPPAELEQAYYRQHRPSA